jgi:hypothetical protein
MFTLEFPQSEQVARVIWSATHAAWELCLGGTTWPNKERRYQRMKSPVAGDLVIEIGGGLREANCANAVGWLLRQTREPVFTEEEWDSPGEPIPTERVFYIQTLNGQECRWVNCEFLAVPEEGGWWTYERQRARDPLTATVRAETTNSVHESAGRRHRQNTSTKDAPDEQ